MYVSDEEMQIITDIAGNVYSYWNNFFNSGLKSNSYDFLLKQTTDYLFNNKIIYTVNDISDIVVSNDSNQKLHISDGYVINSLNQMVKYINEDIYINHLYSYNYPSNGYYGIIIGLSFSDIDISASSYRSTLNESINPGGMLIKVKDISIFNSLSFPCYIQIGTESILVSSINNSTYYANVSLEYNSGNGIIGTYISGIDLFAFNKLQAKVIYGAPVSPSFATPLTAVGFNYYPPTPDDMIILAKVLAQNPVTPATPSATPIIIDIDTSMKPIGAEAQDQPFTVDQQEVIKNYYDLMSNMKNDITYNSALYSLCNSLNNSIYYDIVSNIYSGRDFASYWNHRPLSRASYLKYGVQWDDFERMEFSDGFRRLWYDWSSGTQLLTTLGFFSGNLMDSKYTSGIDIPTNFSASLNSSSGNISPGTWSYAVTAVTVSGESPLSEFINVTIPNNSPNNHIILTWDEVSGASYYNIYRKASVNGINDLKLTDKNEVTILTYVDSGNSTFNLNTNRGIVITNKEIYDSTGSYLYLYIPYQTEITSLMPIENLNNSIGSVTNATQNGINLTMILQKSNGENDTITIPVPAGTAMGTSIPVNSSTKYIKLLDMSVSLIDGDVSIIGSRVNWSYMDVIFLQNIQ